ncbi:hypothetical protein LSTR_LSTR001868 [Laodelphax striatellus]|uniref:Uncharacterized protein n=1 Tax=Laodelphax striatellus TaxID=195883 RepID=A0A482WFX7_LAOST|nr:hypothetical protein LSTR_LSTR001868 [Laodelphax striatellus]
MFCKTTTRWEEEEEILVDFGKFGNNGSSKQREQSKVVGGGTRRHRTSTASAAMRPKWRLAVRLVVSSGLGDAKITSFPCFASQRFLCRRKFRRLELEKVNLLISKYFPNRFGTSHLLKLMARVKITLQEMTWELVLGDARKRDCLLKSLNLAVLACGRFPRPSSAVQCSGHHPNKACDPNWRLSTASPPFLVSSCRRILGKSPPRLTVHSTECTLALCFFLQRKDSSFRFSDLAARCITGCTICSSRKFVAVETRRPRIAVAKRSLTACDAFRRNGD